DNQWIIDCRWTATLNNTKISENTVGEVFHFQAESPGNDSNHITYSVLSGNDGSFIIDPISGRLSIRSGLDRERRSIYRLWIAATDSNTPPKSSITLINIEVEDVNDNSPMFEKNTRSLDREAVSEYNLVVTATDHGKPPLRAEAIVKVKVLDEDDNAPKFSHLFHAEVKEDLEIGAPILLISANDPDESVNHTFSIDDEDLTPFTIDKYTGQISLRRRLDREKEASYRLRVRVSDGTWAVQTGAAINVLDVNDNAPVFEEVRYVFIVNRSQVNQTIGKVQATDADEGVNGVVYYRFDKDIRCLSIDVISGDLRLLCVPDKGAITVCLTLEALSNATMSFLESKKNTLLKQKS
ncbi:unnamed protein product, partial [Cylicostephanus goldi]